MSTSASNPHRKHSIYPQFPPNTRILAKSSTASSLDSTLVFCSSIIILGSVIWLPTILIYIYRRYKSSHDDPRRRYIYGVTLLTLIIILLTGPHRSPRVGENVSVRKWHLWKSWLNYVAFEVITDIEDLSRLAKDDDDDDEEDPTAGGLLFGVVPHGVFPFSLALAALPEAARVAFGRFRPVVATATAFFPIVRTFLSWLRSIDASRPAVDTALSKQQRIGLSPGGIAEMFAGYPQQPGSHVNDECLLLSSRKGFIRLALKHGVPIVPVYCFGASTILKRLSLPGIFERISNWLRMSLVVIVGRWGLPMPFRQKLLYVVGRILYPEDLGAYAGEGEDAMVDRMHEAYCNEIKRIFENNKEAYGWGDKRLRFV